MSTKSTACSEYAVWLAEAPAAGQTSVIQENATVVDSLLHPLAILIRQVLTRAGRLECNLMLIDDEENILQALEAGVDMHSLYYSGGETFSRELLGKIQPHVKVHEVARRTCKKLFENDRVARLFALARPPAAPGLDSLLEVAHDIIVLEDLTITGNIGAIVRTSLAFGAGGIVLLNAEPPDIYDRRLIRASRGHIFSLPVVTATTQEFIHFCRQHKLSMLVMAAQADHPVHEASSLPRRAAIVFGSEKNGCSQSLREAAALQVQIPTDPRVESLNVSTAAAIMLYNRTWFNISRAGK